MWNNPPLNILFENKFTINDTILNESHNRCARAGLPRSAQKPVLMRDQNYLPSTLIAVKKYADLLFVDTRGNISNSNYIFMFSDHDGYILNIHANQDVFVVTDQSRPSIYLRCSKSERNGLSENFCFQTLGVNSITLLAGCWPTRCNTSTR